MNLAALILVTLFGGISIYDFYALKKAKVKTLTCLSNAGYQNADYECGLNCKPLSPGADVSVCKKTLR